MKGPGDWSNAKKARVFAHLIGHLALKYGDRGVIRVPMSVLEKNMTVGFDEDEGDLLIVVDTDATIYDEPDAPAEDWEKVPPKVVTQIRKCVMNVVRTWGLYRGIDVEELLFRLRTRKLDG